MRAVCLLLAGLAAWAQAPNAPLSESAWRHDFDVFAAQFMRGQKDFPKLYQRDGFFASIRGLEERLGTIPDSEVALELMRIVAAGRIAHTHVQIPNTMGFFRKLPVTLYWYPDGLAVIKAAPEYGDAIGARVISIGSMTPDQILAAVSPYVSHENDVWLRETAPDLVVRLAMLQHLKLLDSNGRVEFTLAKPGGARFTISIAMTDPRTAQAGMAAPVPMYRSRQGTYYWYQVLEDSRTVYIQYNRCEEDPQLPFAKFAADVVNAIDSRKAERVVVDLRQNSGGNSAVLDPLKRALIQRPMLRVFVLVGPETFSSALMNALQLREEAHAKLAGAPLGEKPNSYGEIRPIKLPSSNLTIWYSTKFFRLDPHGDPVEITPDIPAPTLLSDDLAGRDPVLEAALTARLN